MNRRGAGEKMSTPLKDDDDGLMNVDKYVMRNKP